MTDSVSGPGKRRPGWLGALKRVVIVARLCATAGWSRSRRSFKGESCRDKKISDPCSAIVRPEPEGGHPGPSGGLSRRAASEIDSILERAGVASCEGSSPVHCWQVLLCSPEKRSLCPEYARRDVPSWIANALAKSGEAARSCNNRAPEEAGHPNPKPQLRTPSKPDTDN